MYIFGASGITKGGIMGDYASFNVKCFISPVGTTRKLGRCTLLWFVSITWDCFTLAVVYGN